jgi:hypothetical protein
VTADESKQLNEAAEMLDVSPDSLVAPDETGWAMARRAVGRRRRRPEKAAEANARISPQ